MADKITHKKTVLLPKWLPIVAEYLTKVENGKGKKYDHPIFAYCIIWLFDVENLDQAINYAFKAIDYGQPMADGIRRSWPSFVADTVYTWAEEQAEKGNSIEPYFGQVFEQVTTRWALREQVSAKYYKFAGLALLRSETGDITPAHVGDIDRLKRADQLLAKAAELHKHAQVKTVRNRIAMRIRALEELNAQ